MKKLLTLLLVFALILSMVTGAFAAEDTEGSEQPQNQVEQTTVTVGTLDELIEAVAAAEDGDTIAISQRIELKNVSLVTDKNITLVPIDDSVGSLIEMCKNSQLSGFTLITNAGAVLISNNKGGEITISNCNFVGNENYYYFLVNITAGTVRISDCNFEYGEDIALTISASSEVVVERCSFNGNTTILQGAGINNSGKCHVKDSSFSNNTAGVGGGIYNSGTMEINCCTYSGNISNDSVGRDIVSVGTLTISDDPQDGEGYYEETTGEKITLPLTDYADTAKLIYLTDDDAEIYFAPEEPPEQPDTPEPIIIYRNVYVRVPVYIEKEPEPAEPALVCGDAVIDVSRSVKLEGYDNGLLHLEDHLTRAQFAKILCGLLDGDTLERYKTSDTVFNDVAPEAWYCPYVNTIAAAGIVCGTGNGNFDPEGILTWAHIITVLSRFVEPQEYNLQHIQYDGWALDSVKTAVALGWITDHAAFNPDAAISRGELAYFVNYVLGLYR